ncbi:GXWXG domain-containing protein, partial [Agromyces seonyuensis]
GATEAHAPERLAAALADGAPIARALDTVGAEATIDQALAALAPRGIAATVALKPGANRIPISQSRLLWGRTLTGVIEGDADVARDIPLLASLWRSGLLPLERLIEPYPFEAVGEAIEDARSGRVVKPVLLLDDDGVLAPPAAPGDLVEALRDGQVAEADLPALWRALPIVDAAELRGLWRGTGLSTGHRTHRLLERSGWFGKRFVADDDVQPIIVERPDGTLEADAGLAGGGASLRLAEHDGLVTAAMAYDTRPVVDLFVRAGPDALLGVMTGRGTLDAGRRYYFLLERVAEPDARA